MCEGQISDDVMIVCQLSENVTKDDLHEMFPEALDVVLPRHRIASQETEKLNARGYLSAALCHMHTFTMLILIIFVFSPVF